jgi:hypothetical protein
MGPLDMQIPWHSAHLLSEPCLHGLTTKVDPEARNCLIDIGGGQTMSFKVIGRIKRKRPYK